MIDYETIYQDARAKEFTRNGNRAPARVVQKAGIDAVVAAAKAEAWDEGLGSGRDRWMDSREFGDTPVNPYRRATDG